MKVVIEIEGREIRQMTREVVVDVPDGTTEHEINSLNVNVICNQIGDEDWQLADSDGVDPDGISYVREADDCDEADCHFLKTEDGELVPEISGDKPVKLLCNCKEGLRVWSCKNCGRKLLICDGCRKTTALYCAEC